MAAIIEPELTISHRLRALRQSGDSAAFLMRRAAADLGERLATVERRFGTAATLHCLTGDAREALAASGKVETVLRIEPDAAFLGGGQGIVAPGEALPLAAQSVDLAVSLLWLQEANDIPGALVQIRRALRPDGLFLAAMAGQGTLAELRDSLIAAETEIWGGASPRVIPFADVRDAGALLQRAGFALPVTDVEPLTIRYDDMFALMADLRAMGATSALIARARRPATRSLFARAAEIYAERYSDPDGRVRATVSIIWMSGWAPHESQQKPLRRGSGQIALGEMLGRLERGEEES